MDGENICIHKGALAIRYADSTREHRDQRATAERRSSSQLLRRPLYRESELQVNPLRGIIHIMDATTRTALIIAFVAVALLLLIFGGGMATGTLMTGGMMGSGSMGGISWIWLLPRLSRIGVVLFSIFGKNSASSRTGGARAAQSRGQRASATDSRGYPRPTIAAI